MTLTVQSSHEDNSELGQISNVIKGILTLSITLSSAAEETSQTCEYNSQSLVEQQDGIAVIAIAIEELPLR